TARDRPKLVWAYLLRRSAKRWWSTKVFDKFNKSETGIFQSKKSKKARKRKRSSFSVPFIFRSIHFKVFFQRNVRFINFFSHGVSNIAEMPGFVHVTRQLFLAFRIPQDKTVTVRVGSHPLAGFRIAEAGRSPVFFFAGLSDIKCQTGLML